VAAAQWEARGHVEDPAFAKKAESANPCPQGITSGVHYLKESTTALAGATSRKEEGESKTP